MEIWKRILSEPGELADDYEELWQSQLADPRRTYDRIREEYNASPDGSRLLYLIVRCVKNAVRFNPKGAFNQSPDNRRLGMRPWKMRRELHAASHLLTGKTTAISADYRNVLNDAKPEDLVCMDPPYPRVS